MRLEGRNAVVVGVGSIIGRACAITFAREGANILAVDPGDGTAADVARAIASTGGLAQHQAADLASEGAAKHRRTAMQ